MSKIEHKAVQNRKGGLEIQIEEANLEELVRVYAQSVYEPIEVEEKIDGLKAYFRNELLKNPRTVLLFDEDDPSLIIGVGSWNVVAHEPKILIELTKLTILSNRQGMGLSKKLMDMLEISIRDEWQGEYGQLMITRNPRVILPALNSGYANIGVDAYWRLMGRDPEEEAIQPEAWINSLKERGYTALLKEVPSCTAESQKVADTERATAEAVAPILGDLDS